MTCPCYTCRHRFAACWGVCKDYAAFRADVERKKEYLSSTDAERLSIEHKVKNAQKSTHAKRARLHM
jgi:hypothetical protein